MMGPISGMLGTSGLMLHRTAVLENQTKTNSSL